MAHNLIPVPQPPLNAIAFPRLTPGDIALLRILGTSHWYEDGETVFRAGRDAAEMYVVESGAMDILNPAQDNRHVVTHGPGEFSGDIDLLTRRPPIVTAVARGRTQLTRVPGERLREVLIKIPHVGEILLAAALERRRLLLETGSVGLKVVGPGKCRDTMLVREFLYKNFVPFIWYDSASEEGQRLMASWGMPPRSPVIEFGNGERLINPTLQQLSLTAGVWRHCPTAEVDLAIVGAGPAGMAAAVYAASEGVSTDRARRPWSRRPGRSDHPRSRISSAFPAGCPAPTWPCVVFSRCSSSERRWSPR